MLQVQKLNKELSNNSFRISDISFHLPKGYICGLIGENGAGKTTLMRLLMGLLSFSGSITIDGYDIVNDEALAKGKLGFIFENGFFEKNMNLEQIGVFYGGLYSAFEMGSYLSYLERFKLDKKERYKNLSRGMGLKVQLAFALPHDAKLFLFDEPTAGLDKHFREEFLNICADIVSDGERSIIISSHITEDLDRIADYIAYMQNGKMLFFNTKEDLCDKFLIVRGEDYKCNLISREAVIYKEKGEYSSSAMVVNSKRYAIDQTLEIKCPDIREFMHYLVKGGRENAEAVAKKYLQS